MYVSCHCNLNTYVCQLAYLCELGLKLYSCYILKTFLSDQIINIWLFTFTARGSTLDVRMCGRATLVSMAYTNIFQRCKG